MFKKLTTVFMALVLLSANAVGISAVGDFVSIADLPDYTTTNALNLSYTAYSEGSVAVKFFVKKEGGSYSQFGPTHTTPSGTQATNDNQINDQTKYYFKVELNGAVTDETSVVYDVSGPSPVKDYYKETISPTHVKLNWRNPNDSDFYKVIIYRSTSSSYIADDNTKVAEIVGPRDGVMSWEDAGQEAGKSYYYAIRAVDNAGNGSSLVADAGASVLGTTTEPQGGSAATGQGEGEVTDLPGTGGQILGDESAEGEDGEGESEAMVDQDETGSLQETEMTEDASDSTVRNILLGLGILLVLYSAYSFFFKREK